MSKPFTVQSDASDRAIGAVLSQLDDSGKEHPVAYLSRKLDSAQEKYSYHGERVPGNYMGYQTVACLPIWKQLPCPNRPQIFTMVGAYETYK